MAESQPCQKPSFLDSDLTEQLLYDDLRLFNFPLKPLDIKRMTILEKMNFHCPVMPSPLAWERSVCLRQTFQSSSLGRFSALPV